ncbi:uncharacterized protein LOC100890042 [Strongylocentrotus purpuratus]|uniref:Uncharacterized protein n=1 Tax=Strongylocentrotus purpuratus TaxID=7668 RepID=A0A7M7GPM9_STRPU|nr:uncharacterized protein LOC100890042 [Strongylocentrotus purpuratus]|eukprot:XP_003726130.1 PREDICTED: uncharacterized protein LOC100890042 [Strongylocentrotus purpuratus]
MYKLMMEKEEDRESFLPKYERDYGEHGPITGEPPNQDHGQPKNKCRPPPDPANFEHNDDSPPFDHDNNVKERGYTSAPGVDIELGDQPQSSKMEDIAGLPHGDDGMEEEEKLSQPSSLSSKDGGVHLPSFPDDEGGFMEAVEMPNTHLSEGNQFSMPKSLSSQLDEKLSQPTSLSSEDGGVSQAPLPDDEGGNMQAVEMPNKRLSGGEQFSIRPKSLSSQLDEKLSQPTSLSSDDGGILLAPLPDDEGDIMQAVEMPTTDLSGGEQFSIPKSLSSQPDKILSVHLKRVG